MNFILTKMRKLLIKIVDYFFPPEPISDKDVWGRYNQASMEVLKFYGMEDGKTEGVRPVMGAPVAHMEPAKEETSIYVILNLYKQIRDDRTIR